jgi:hypothetical protein
MAHRLEPTELLDVEMKQFAAGCPLVSADRFGRLQRVKPTEPVPPQDESDGRARKAELTRYGGAEHARAPQR